MDVGLLYSFSAWHLYVDLISALHLLLIYSIPIIVVPPSPSPNAAPIAPNGESSCCAPDSDWRGQRLSVYRVVSSGTGMGHMFRSARAFNVDISKCDVFRVTSKIRSKIKMFFHAATFNQKLCGTTCACSKASKSDMFVGSSGSISQTACM